MSPSTVSQKKSLLFSAALFFLGIIVLTFNGAWWPGIMVAVGLPLALRQYLLGRPYDMCISLLVFLGTFISVEFDIAWKIFLPILFTLGAIYTLVKEFIDLSAQDEPEQEEDLNHEIEEKNKD